MVAPPGHAQEGGGVAVGDVVKVRVLDMDFGDARLASLSKPGKGAQASGACTVVVSAVTKLVKAGRTKRWKHAAGEQAYCLLVCLLVCRYVSLLALSVCGEVRRDSHVHIFEGFCAAHRSARLSMSPLSPPFLLCSARLKLLDRTTEALLQQPMHPSTVDFHDTCPTNA